MLNLKRFVATICSLFGVVEAERTPDGRGTIITIRGSIQQLKELFSMFGAEPIKAKGHTQAMSYCPRLKGFVHVSGDYAVVVVPDPDAGFIAVHFVGTP